MYPPKIAGHVVLSYRSSLQNYYEDNMFEAAPNLRTLIGFDLPSFSLPKLRYLRVLHVEKSRVMNLSRAISGCIHLRCLRLIGCDGVTLPSSLGQLLYLQTIDLRYTDLESEVPKSIWAIPALRHVYLGEGCRIGSSPPRNGPPKELQVLHIYAGGNDCFQGGMVAFWGQMTQLTTLYLYASDMPAPMIHILANMTYLVEATLGIFERLNKLPESQLFPQGLRQLRLWAVAIEEDPMPILEKLPCLVVLLLRGYSGSIMVCSAQGFPRLQELDLRYFACDEWRIEIGAMPSLSLLVLLEWPNMPKLPEGLLYLPSLKELSLEVSYKISEDDVTWKNLHGKGCKVSCNFPPSHFDLNFLLYFKE